MASQTAERSVAQQEGTPGPLLDGAASRGAVTTDTPHHLPRPALILAVLGLLFAGWWFLIRRPPVPSNIIPVSGRVEGDESTVAARTAARVREVLVREGDSVKKGQLLAVLDDDQVRARQEQAQAALDQAEAKAASASHQISVYQQNLRQSRLAVGQARLDTEGRIQTARQQVYGADAALAQALAKERAATQQIAILREQLQQAHLAVGQSRLDAQGRVLQAEQQLAAAQAAAEQASAQYEQARIDAARYASLLADGNVSKREAELFTTSARTTLSALTAARKQVEAARGTLTAARANLANPAVRSSQEAAVRSQIAQAEADLAGARAAVRLAQAQRAQAGATLTTTQAVLSNPEVKQSQETAAQRQIEQAQAELEAARAAAKQAQAKLSEARADRADLRVLAPFDGTVATRVAEPGEVVVNGTPLLTMLDMDKVYLRAFIPEGDIGKVKVGQQARVFLDSDPRAPLEAVVSRIDPKLSFTPENTYFRNERVKQVVGVKLQLKAGFGYAKPGMPADGEVLVDGDWPAREPWR